MRSSRSRAWPGRLAALVPANRRQAVTAPSAAGGWRMHQAGSSHAQPAPAKPSQARPSQARPSQAKERQPCSGRRALLNWKESSVVSWLRSTAQVP